MALNAFAGTGTSLSANFYLRKFYVANTDARTSSKRSSYTDSELSRADGMALRRAVKNLGSFAYEESRDANIRNSVNAYISTYNNTISSLSDSEDATLEKNLKRLKALTKEYSSELDKIGITIKDDGTLSSRDALFKSADLSKFEKLFSKDSDYMQRISAYGKRIERQSSDLCAIEQAKKHASPSTKTDSSASKGETTAAAQIVAEALDLDVLLNTGIGKNINISL